MPKRKAKDSGDEEPRRSTRKIAAVKDAGLPGQTEASKPAPGSKSQSKSSKAKTGSHAKKKDAPITNGDENENEKTDDSVGFSSPYITSQYTTLHLNSNLVTCISVFMHKI